MKTVRMTYPIASLLSAILLAAYFYCMTHADLIFFYRIPVWVFAESVQLSLLAMGAVIVIVELRYFQYQHTRQRESISQIKIQIEELLENRKLLHAKAHVYAGHADKLKLFISDKLLEYIEYDEKFLHFKSIASEVRHNGVISYDKIKTVLNLQLDTIEDTEGDVYRRCKEARDSLMYLWDLLDLSTADNIALHIASQVCEHEELLFQAAMSKDNDNTPPAEPVFLPQEALQKALLRCFGTQLDDTSGTFSIDHHEQAWVSMHSTDKLLGNENHVVLALENILNNAQFFAGRRSDRQKRTSIAIELDQKDGHIRYRVYNRGPHIDEQTATQLFQLGYSTRRAKENHGKGLGLYFVNEIVKGYDGKVSFSNVHNQADVLSLRLEMASGEVITDVIELVVEDKTPLCRKSGVDTAEKSLDWQLFGELISVEITHQSDQKTHRRLSEALAQGEVLDPSQPAYPRWSLEIKPKSRHTTLQFKPLDIAGVQFELRLPSLTARIEGELLNADEAFMDDEVNEIKEKFKGIEQLN